MVNDAKYAAARERVAIGKWIVDPERGVVLGRGGRPLGSLDADGYTVLGTTKYRGIMLHRVVWEAVHGPVPTGLQINHKVGVKHGGSNSIDNLELVSASENIVHSYATGLNSAVGERQHSARLTREAVVAIRAAYAAGSMSQDQLAHRYGVAQSTISKVVLGQTWKQVTGWR